MWNLLKIMINEGYIRESISLNVIIIPRHTGKDPPKQVLCLLHMCNDCENVLRQY